MASQYDFLDSFGDRPQSKALKKRWTSTVGFAANFALVGRFPNQWAHQIGGLNGLYLDYGGSAIRGGSGFTAKIGVGVAVKVSATQGIWGGASIFSTLAGTFGGGGMKFNLNFTADGRICVEKEGGGTIPETVCNLGRPLFLNTWWFIEWEMTYHEASDDLHNHSIDCKIWVEGVLLLDVSGIDLGNPTVVGHYINPSAIRFTSAQSSGFVTEYCDFYFRIAGAFGSGLRVLDMHPESDFLIEWDEPISPAPHYTEVQEEVLDLVDFIRGGNVWPKVDEFQLEDLPASVDGGRHLRMVQFEYYVEGTDGGDDVWVRAILPSGGGDILQPEVGIDGYYQTWVHDSSPFVGGPYLASDFDATIAGVQVDLL